MEVCGRKARGEARFWSGTEPKERSAPGAAALHAAAALPHRACAVLYEPRRTATTGTTGSVDVGAAEPLPPAALKAYQQDLSGRRCFTRSQLRACSCGTRCCARWWTRRCPPTRRRTRPVPHRSRQPRELLEGWTPEQTRAAAASSAVRDVLDLEPLPYVPAGRAKRRPASSRTSSHRRGARHHRVHQLQGGGLVQPVRPHAESNRPEAPGVSHLALRPRYAPPAMRASEGDLLPRPASASWLAGSGGPASILYRLAFDRVGTRRTSSDACWKWSRLGAAETACGHRCGVTVGSAWG